MSSGSDDRGKIAVLLNGLVRMPSGVGMAIRHRGVLRKPCSRVSMTRRQIPQHDPLVSCGSVVEAL